jgi:hypothetical protein
MSEPRSKGALVLLCRSKFDNHFSSFKPILIDRLKNRFGVRIQFVDILTTQELTNNLFNPITLFDIAELHILAEYDSGRLLVNVSRDMYIEAGKIADIKGTSRLGITGGEFLPDAMVKLWYSTRSEGPGINMLNEWSDYFKRRFFFLPLTQLKRPVKPSAKKKVLKKAFARSTGKESPYTSPSFFGHMSMTKIIMILAAIGGLNHIIADKSEIRGEYDQVVNHEDSPDEIAALARNLKSVKGHLVEHSWVFKRTRWDFTFFVAGEWLHYSDRELDAAAASTGNGHEYWGKVYRKIINSNDRRLDNVAIALRDHGRELNLDRHDMATFVLSFVQHISYKIPNNNLELLAPPQTVREAYGDCDSKSLLYALILRKLGYDTVMYVNRGLRHAMAGVSTAATGKYLPYHGARYYFAETTAIGHRIGQLSGGTSGWHLLML